MSRRLEGKVVIVTGSAMGIGRATAILAAEEGARVAVCDIANDEGQKTVQEINKSKNAAQFYHMDVSKESEVRETFRKITNELGPVFGLVNNAGIDGANKPTHEINEAEWDRVFNVNVKGTFLCTKHAVPYLIKNGGGSIVNMSSVASRRGNPILPDYHATKAAVRLMTRCDALAYAKHNIRVNSVHPGSIDTPMVRAYAISTGKEEETYEEMRKSYPMGRIGKPEEVASAVIFLLSNDSSFTTGSELVIDGGLTAR